MIRHTGYPLTLKILAAQEIEGLKSDCKYELTIRKKSKRSLEQNRMLWKNIQIASEQIGQDPMDTYCDLLVQSQALSDVMYTIGEMQDEMKACFRAVKLMNTDEDGHYFYQVFPGSSKMSTKECTQLLEKSFDLLSELGVNYQTPDW